MITDDLEEFFLAPGRGQTSAWRWATVTDTDPLRVRFDGESTPLAIPVPDLASGGHQVGDRVWAQFAGRRVIVHGPARVQCTHAQLPHVTRANVGTTGVDLMRVTFGNPFRVPALARLLVQQRVTGSTTSAVPGVIALLEDAADGNALVTRCEDRAKTDLGTLTVEVSAVMPPEALWQARVLFVNRAGSGTVTADGTITVDGQPAGNYSLLSVAYGAAALPVTDVL